MSNRLVVRRVQMQTIDEQGNPIGPPSFAVEAFNAYEQGYSVSFPSLESLNANIDLHPSILGAVRGWRDLFLGADHKKIGRDNFDGENWEKD